MNGSESKSLLKAEDRRVAQVVSANNERRDDEDNDWWASDSGSSTGSYYSDSDRYKRFNSKSGSQTPIFYVWYLCTFCISYLFIHVTLFYIFYFFIYPSNSIFP